MSRMLSPQDLEICSVAQAPELETALRQLEQGPWLHRLQHRVVARIPVGWVKMETPLPDDSSWYHPGEGVAPRGAVAEGRRSSCYWQAERKLLQEVCWGRRLDANVKVASLNKEPSPAPAQPQGDPCDPGARPLHVQYRLPQLRSFVSAPPAAGSHQPRQRLGLSPASGWVSVAPILIRALVRVDPHQGPGAGRASGLLATRIGMTTQVKLVMKARLLVQQRMP